MNVTKGMVEHFIISLAGRWDESFMIHFKWEPLDLFQVKAIDILTLAAANDSKS
jgi:hypothetical protein